jgi:4-carboxymuconolactone decarboxylase
MTRRSARRPGGRRLLGPLALALAVSTTQLEAQAVSDIVVSRSGDRGEPQIAPREHFTGVARVYPMFDAPAAAGARPSGGIASFDTGARTAWHTHPRGQTLIVTAGVGRVQRWGGPAEEIRPGDVVWIPPGVKHWHGAAPTTSMTHVALTEALDGKGVEWMEHVTDVQYGAPAGAATAPAAGGPAGAQPSAAQRAMGDIAPHLAELTDRVLFGDVWARAGLSRRDRSLATVSALIAMNRPDQLRSHLALALRNGVTREELVETITQLAFYAGWPSAVTAVGVARQVFAETAR